MNLLGLIYMPALVSSAVFLSIGSPIVTVGFSLSEELLGRDFSFHHDVGKGGRGKSEKGRKGAETGHMIRLKREEEGRQAVVLTSMGEEVPTLRIHQNETKRLCGKEMK